MTLQSHFMYKSLPSIQGMKTCNEMSITPSSFSNSTKCTLAALREGVTADLMFSNIAVNSNRTITHYANKN